LRKNFFLIKTFFLKILNSLKEILPLKILDILWLSFLFCLIFTVFNFLLFKILSKFLVLFLKTFKNFSTEISIKTLETNSFFFFSCFNFFSLFVNVFLNQSIFFKANFSFVQTLFLQEKEEISISSSNQVCISFILGII
jgi:hypothetical protein